VSTSPEFITGGSLYPVSTARPAARDRNLKPVLLATASLISLAGFALVASALRAPYGLATALLGFAGYVFLMAKALQCLHFDWDIWTNRRKPATPPLPSPRGKLVPFGRGTSATA
jgi:hypothetical protein